MKRRGKDESSIVHFVIGGAFLVALWLSPLQGLFGFIEEPRQMENRRLASMPKNKNKDKSKDMNVASLVLHHRSDLNDYFRDHFGFRRTLIRWHHRAKLRLLDKSPVPTVIVGQDGWLYQGEKDPLDDLRPMTPLPDRLFAKWDRRLHGLAKWLGERGVQLLVVIVPEKQTIYPDSLPERLRPFKQSSRTDDLLARLAERGPLDIVDLRPVVRDAARSHQTFHRTDTHWNDLGAFAGYQAIVNRLSEWFPQMQPWPISEFRIERTIEKGGNLARMLRMEDLFPEQRFTLSPLSPRLAKRVGSRRKQMRIGRKISMQQDNQDLPSAVVFHDSFADYLIPLLSEHFSRIDYLSAVGEDRMLIERSQPDVVIWEIAEGLFQRR